MIKIEPNEIIKDMNILSNKLASTTDIKEYSYILSNINLLSDLYKTLTGEEISKYIILKRNLILESQIDDEDIDEYYRKLFLTTFDVTMESANSVFCTLFKIDPFLKKTKYEKEAYLEEEEARIVLPDVVYQSLLIDFLTSLGNKELLDIYNNLLKSKTIDLDTFRHSNNRLSSETNNIFTLNKSYVLITQNNYDIISLLALIHEIGHVYAQRHIHDNSLAYDDVKTNYEFYSSFMERLFIKYLRENKILEKGSIYLDDIYMYYLKKYANRLINKGGRENISITTAMIYFYGEYVSLIKEWDYINDKYTTNKQIEEYLNHQGLLTRKEELDILGINEEELKSGNKLQLLLNSYR